MKKSMSILLIIIGVALSGYGIFSLTHVKQPQEPVTDSHRVATVADLPNDSLSDSERKGQQFEDFVVSQFSAGDYTLVEKVNDYTSRHHNTERSRYADLVFRKKATGEEFAIECKYRSDWMDYKGEPAIHWVEQRKIDDYNRFSEERDIDVIVLFGVGGTPSQPEHVYALPLRLLQKPLPQRKAFLQKFEVADGNYVYDSHQHNLI